MKALEIIRARQRAGMSRAEFAEYIGCRERDVRDFELGASYPTGGPRRQIQQLMDMQRQPVFAEEP